MTRFLLLALTAAVLAAQPREKNARVEGAKCEAENVLGWLGTSSKGMFTAGRSQFQPYDPSSVRRFGEKNPILDCVKGIYVRDLKAERGRNRQYDRTAKFASGQLLTADDLARIRVDDIQGPPWNFGGDYAAEKQREFAEYLHKQIIAQLLELRRAVAENDSDAARIAKEAITGIAALGYRESVK